MPAPTEKQKYVCESLSTMAHVVVPRESSSFSFRLVENDASMELAQLSDGKIALASRSKAVKDMTWWKAFGVMELPRSPMTTTQTFPHET